MAAFTPNAKQIIQIILLKKGVDNAKSSNITNLVENCENVLDTALETLDVYLDKKIKDIKNDN